MRVSQVQHVKGIFWSSIAANESANFVNSTPALAISSLPYHVLSPARAP